MDSSYQIFWTAFISDSRALLIIRSLDFYEAADILWGSFIHQLYLRSKKIFQNKLKSMDAADPR